MSVHVAVGGRVKAEHAGESDFVREMKAAFARRCEATTAQERAVYERQMTDVMCAHLGGRRVREAADSRRAAAGREE